MAPTQPVTRSASTPAPCRTAAGHVEEEREESLGLQESPVAISHPRLEGVGQFKRA